MSETLSTYLDDLLISKKIFIRKFLALGKITSLNMEKEINNIKDQLYVLFQHNKQYEMGDLYFHSLWKEAPKFSLQIWKKYAEDKTDVEELPKETLDKICDLMTEVLLVCREAAEIDNVYVEPTLRFFEEFYDFEFNLLQIRKKFPEFGN